MSNEKATLDTVASQRPLMQYTARDEDILDFVDQLAKFFIEANKGAADHEIQMARGAADRLRWAVERFHAYESNLLGLGVNNMTTRQVNELLEKRFKSIYYVFGDETAHLSDDELVEMIQQSNNPILTSRLTFDMSRHVESIHYPSLISSFLDAADRWFEKVHGTDFPINKEPEMFVIRTVADNDNLRQGEKPVERTRRYISYDWLQWWNRNNPRHGGDKEEAVKVAIGHLTAQLFPEGKPVDIQVRTVSGPFSGGEYGLEVEFKRVISNVEYF